MHKMTNIGHLCWIQFSSKVALGHFRRIKLSTQALLTEEKVEPRLIRDPLTRLGPKVLDLDKRKELG